MYGAGEIHRFNRDVEDALTRIQEKYSSIPEDQGRDLFATQSYLKKHERFENELVALEAQVPHWIIIFLLVQLTSNNSVVHCIYFSVC
jgi:hypothetical protein